MLADSRQEETAWSAMVVSGHLGDRLGSVGKGRKGISLANMKSMFKGIRSDTQNSINRHSLVFFC